MNIAVFNNFMDNIGGSEMVTLFLARELNADIYTTNIDAEKIKKMGFADVLGRIHSIGRVPRKAPFRHQLAFWKFRRLDLSGKYDFFIISGEWAMSGALRNHPNMWYVHGPLNELWEFGGFLRKYVLAKWHIPFYAAWVWVNRRLTLSYARSVDVWVCNSKNTQGRIRRYYGKESAIINPPVDASGYEWREGSGYWLSVSRLTAHKRIELQMEAFRRLPHKRLVIVGSYESGAAQFESYKARIEKMKPENVKLLHWVDADKLRTLYAECDGFVTTTRDEDFGMNVVEAMAAGKPVVAPNEGGYRETVTGETGMLIDGITAEKIADAIEEISERLRKNPAHYRDACVERARAFDIGAFTEKIRTAIEAADSGGDSRV